jgi:hypothetical protein
MGIFPVLWVELGDSGDCFAGTHLLNELIGGLLQHLGMTGFNFPLGVATIFVTVHHIEPLLRTSRMFFTGQSSISVRIDGVDLFR